LITSSFTQQPTLTFKAEFYIERDGIKLELYCPPNRRYFSLNYSYRVSYLLEAKYEEEAQILRGRIKKYDIEENKIGDENLNQIVSFHEIKDIDNSEIEDMNTKIQSYIIHSDCRIIPLQMEDPRQDSDGEEWDGIQIKGLLYPFEDDFSPINYERTAQEVISVAKQAEDSIKALDVLEQAGY
jgi:predicted RNA-binding protein